MTTLIKTFQQRRESENERESERAREREREREGERARERESERARARERERESEREVQKNYPDRLVLKTGVKRGAIQIFPLHDLGESQTQRLENRGETRCHKSFFFCFLFLLLRVCVCVCVCVCFMIKKR